MDREKDKRAPGWLEAEIAALLKEQWDPHRLPISAFGGMVSATSTTSAAAAAPPLTLEAANRMLAEFDRLIRESRRTNVTVIVVDGYEGPPLLHQHPTDGRFIECDVRTALTLHQEVPLRLVKVVSRDSAHFEVATPFAPAMRWLPIPPYESPPNEVPEGD